MSAILLAFFPHVVKCLLWLQASLPQSRQEEGKGREVLAMPLSSEKPEFSQKPLWTSSPVSLAIPGHMVTFSVKRGGIVRVWIYSV